MKKLLSFLSISLFLGFISQHETKAEQTNDTGRSIIPGGGLPPLPAQFAGMTNLEIHPGLRLLAIYQFKDSKVAFTCVGGLFQTDTNEWSITLPEHLFPKDGTNEHTYVFRIARPDSGRIDGCVGPIIASSKDMHGCDIAIAKAVGNLTPIRGFSTLFSETNGTVIAFSNGDPLTVRGKQVTTLRSHITGKPVKILGYGLRPTAKLRLAYDMRPTRARPEDIDEEYPLIIVEEPVMAGKSGTAFVDEHGRIFLISRVVPMSGTMRQEETVFQQLFGRPSSGITFLTGPFALEPEN